MWNVFIHSARNGREIQTRSEQHTRNLCRHKFVFSACEAPWHKACVQRTLAAHWPTNTQTHTIYAYSVYVCGHLFSSFYFMVNYKACASSQTRTHTHAHTRARSDTRDRDPYRMPRTHREQQVEKIACMIARNVCVDCVWNWTVNRQKRGLFSHHRFPFIYWSHGATKKTRRKMCQKELKEIDKYKLNRFVNVIFPPLFAARRYDYELLSL